MSEENEIKLWAAHIEALKERAISPEYAWACGLRSWSGKEAQRLLSQYRVTGPYPGLPLYRHGTGIEIPYAVESADGVPRCRIRLDDTSIEVESEPGRLDILKQRNAKRRSVIIRWIDRLRVANCH